MIDEPLIPVAQHVRMSDEAQQYSVDNQKLAIQEYASRHGFTIVKTYADLGKSGVVAKHRTALQELLRDVVSGHAGYKAILVYDVSRWVDFPTTMKPHITSLFALVLPYRFTTALNSSRTMVQHQGLP
jgi:DNA invertase Pin-like site-specific DNA recombinase